MVYREVAMWEILTVLRRIGRGETKAGVARQTGHTRATVRRYVKTALALRWRPGQDEPTEELAAAVARQLSPRGEPSAGEVEARLLAQVDALRTWLEPPPGERRGLRLTKVHELLVRQGVVVPYSSLHRFVVKHCGFGRRGHITVRVADCQPGEQAEVDFGRLGLVWDPERSRRRTAWALVVVLGYSRHQYVHVTFAQRLADLSDGLEDAWAFFGGVVQRLVLDNLRSGVLKADRYDPIFQRTFEEYAAYRGVVLDAAPVRQPTGKPRVERSVPYVRESLFRGEEWRDLEHVQRQAIVWCLGTAGTRIHGTTRQRPLAVFENTERAALLSLTPPERFDPPDWARGRVHPDHHVSFGKALYSVPTRFIGQTVWVRADRTLVRLYADGTLIKTHPRQAPGGRSTDHTDYPAALTPYTLRDPARLIRQAEQHGEHLGRVARALLAGPVPWAKLRQAQKLLRLGEKYGGPRLDEACQRALGFDLINVRRVDAILRHGLERVPRPAAAGPTAVRSLPLRFARAAESFSHAPRKETPHE
jgi:hypothetical protein